MQEHLDIMDQVDIQVVQEPKAILDQQGTQVVGVTLAVLAT